MTNDVEHHSIPLNREDSNVPDMVYAQGLPRILDLFAKYDVSSTFYFTGMFAEDSPESVELVVEHGHEVGCHGYDHSPLRAFDVLDHNAQVSDLQKAKRILEPIAGKVISFRAPALRLNNDTISALERTGFVTDSSVSSQRFDGPLTFGSRKKLQWLTAPRSPYYVSYESPMRKGSSNIFEVPISALLFPFIGTTMRVSPQTTRILERLLFFESNKTGKPIVFLFHPNECLDVSMDVQHTRRSSNIAEYIFADLIRQKLKLRNLGSPSINLLEQVLRSAKDHDFEFVSIREYAKMSKNKRMTEE